ncbi:MAG: FtsL-like putative cell division protein [Bacteroidaceae bacterium]|nr:FtsL-like putative cell division protein [Bacteroidaceae bacterium]
MTFSKIILGDALDSEAVRKQAGLIFLMGVLSIFYIGNRYGSQHDQIVIQKLKSELVTKKYDALAKSAQLMQLTRRTNIESLLKKYHSEVKPSKLPPFVITSKEKIDE